jgi:hypothetical protein
MNSHLQALTIYLSTLTPSPSGWLTIDRAAVAAHLGVSRIELARVLAKAGEKAIIAMDEDRIFILDAGQRVIRGEKAVRKRKPPTLQQMIAAAESVMAGYKYS